MAGKCSHGYSPGPSQSWNVSGSTEKSVAKHERACRKFHPFWHQGWIFRVICCAGCGKKIY